ncbi:DUF550 domain-containing protein [Escherichia coli]|nr:DUF550 domain-containing protein [Escherichia coli]EHO6532096.1 DUF550 domain-containing protein [Escherichia coli]EKM4394735.1 DUF550 domain-containing protein [Escherichia coli]ELM5932421.1 DUF550 domain-containing protein [Escherichia coli]ELM5947157.1 DUF550 domain-containing protein [Escherichia coli]
MNAITKEQLIEDLKASTQNSSGMFEIGEDTICNLMSMLTAHPAPVAPDEMTPQQASRSYGGEVRGYRDGWNACRAAMLQGVEPASNHEELSEENGSSLQLRNLIRQRHAEWSDKTFGCVGPVGPLKHLSKEALEAAAEPDDLSEWADMQFLLWDAQRRAGISDAEITAAMEDKLKINMERQWPEPKDGEPRLHIKEPGNSPVTPDGWISCSERMPNTKTAVLVAVEFDRKGDWRMKWATYIPGHPDANDGWIIPGASWKPSHWMPLPEPPQEVK